MAKPKYSERTRRKARRMVENGLTFKKTSEKLGIPLTTVREWCHPDVKSPRSNVKEKDIIQILEEKPMTAGQIEEHFGKENKHMRDRLKDIARRKKIKYVYIPYIEKDGEIYKGRLYYLKEGQLKKWIEEIKEDLDTSERKKLHYRTRHLPV